MSSDDDEAFEDAMEDIAPLPSDRVKTCPPSSLSLSSISPAWSQCSPMDPLAQNAVARQERLSNLRKRMWEEFGLNKPQNMNGDADTMSMNSETTSLHSWHHNLLTQSATIVRATDTMSTRAMSTSGGAEHWSRMQSPSCSSPPPLQPPPPLPTPRTTVPPPLPPRTPSLRLPDPVANELVSRLREAERERLIIQEEDSSMEEMNDTLNDTATMISPRLSPTNKVIPANVTQRTSQSSNDSIGMTSTSEVTAIPAITTERRRGHAKTNSLDRGLMLAKSIKTGPFPPPASKTNSLTRQERDEECEEEERNNMADRLIQQLTTTVIGDELDRSLDPIPSEPSCSSNSSDRSSVDGKRKTNKKHPETGKESTLEKVPEGNSAPELHDRTTRNGDETLSTTQNNMSIDPITRDVERRMSMKGHGQLGTDQLSDDGRSESAAPSSSSSMAHARTTVREYGNLAGGLVRGFLTKAKTALHGGASTSKGVESDSRSESEIEETADSGMKERVNALIVRPRNAKKGPFDFEQTQVVQELSNEHTGAVWCIRFSICGRLMATAGQDAIIRVWCVRSHLNYFVSMREKYQQKRGSMSPSSPDAYDKTISEFESDIASLRPPSSGESVEGTSSSIDEDDSSLFSTKPFAVFKGHTSDILDLSWSKNYFILSSGMDRTVKLWHLSRSECLCCFQHIDFVTCVAFLPKDDRYFLSGSLDGKLRLWHIPEKKVALWNEVQVKFITALCFAKSGKFAVVGTYNGRCYFYTTDLKYHTVVDVRSSRGKNARGHKVTGLAVHGDKLLVTSNDSRIRMYDVRDKALTCKFKGSQNERSQIRAAFSPDGKHIICGSEDRFIYIWRTSDLPSSLSVRKDRNAQWERIRAHSWPVSVACFAPKPQIFLSILDRIGSGKQRGDGMRARWDQSSPSSTNGNQAQGDVIASADLSGCIKIMVNKHKATKAGLSTFFSQTPREG